MKKITVIFGGLALGAAIMLMPQSSKASIIGSKHDFSSYTNYWIGGVSGGDFAVSHGSTNVCGECHTIHHAPDPARGPLWIHTPTSQTFETYDHSGSETFPSGVTVSLGSSSKACLSCHDGTVAVNSQDALSGSTITTTIAGGTPVYINSSDVVIEVSGGLDDLTHMHPIGVSYASCISALPANSLNGVGTAFNAPGSPTVGNMLKGGNVECSSCHDIHRTLGASTTSGIYTIASGQALCLGCHNK
jgi:predicted CXXCH cytochrome family protein